MKCKDCNSTLCSHRTSDAEKDCFYESHPDYPMPIDLWNNENTDWQSLRNQAAIAAMQGTITILGSSNRYAFTEVVVEGYKGKEKTYPKEIAQFSVACADALIEELKKK